MTYEQAAETIYSSPWTIRRMERAEGGLKPLDRQEPADGLRRPPTSARSTPFCPWARDASKPGWWHSYDDVLPSWFRIAVGLEESASLIRTYEPQVVPGLLQTEGYIRAINRPLASPPPPTRKPNAGWRCGSRARNCSGAPKPPSTGW